MSLYDNQTIFSYDEIPNMCNPVDAVYEPEDTSFIYYLDGCYSSLFVVEATDEQIIEKIDLPVDCPQALDVNPTTNTIYIIDSCSNTLSIFDTQDYDQLGQLTLPFNCLRDIAINPTTNMVYFADGCSNTLPAINATTTNITTSSINHTLALGPLEDIEIDHNTNKIYGVNGATHEIFVADAKTGVVRMLPYNNVNDVALDLDEYDYKIYLSHHNGENKGESILIIDAGNYTRIKEVPLVINTPKNCC